MNKIKTQVDLREVPSMWTNPVGEAGKECYTSACISAKRPGLLRLPLLILANLEKNSLIHSIDDLPIR